MDATRQHFREELERLERAALEGLDMVTAALDRALDALRHQDVELASMIVADDDRIDERYLEVHQGVLALLALQAPVATDLRLLVAILQVVKHIERMGDQCVNVAKVIPLAGHEPPTDERILELVERMGLLARSLIAQSRVAFERRDAELAEDLIRQDDEIDALNKRIFRRALAVGDDGDLREWAMHMVLAGRALERIADNAVDIGEQTAFVVTGLLREFDDASRVKLRG